MEQCVSLQRQTGWRWETSELSHFLARPKAFVPEVAEWRRQLVIAVRGGTYDLLSHLTEEDAAKIRGRLDDAIAWLREIARILALLYPGDDNERLEPVNRDDAAPDGAGWETLARLDPFRSLETTLTNVPHCDRTDAWQLVPPPMRALLSRRLLRHSQEVCRPETPDCADCELARFCQMERARRLARAEATSKPIVMDLFAGAGGISLGFSRSGFRPVLAIDASPAACTTYRLNHCDIAENAVVCADIREVNVEELAARLDGRQLDVLIGAPPCQGFSLAGFRSRQSMAARQKLAGYCISEDDRNYLFQYVVGAAIMLRPKLVLMENVPGMDSPRNGAASFMRIAEQTLRDAGFLTAIWKLDAAAYGVPQRRTRNLLIASTIGRLPAMPEADYQSPLSRSFELDALPPVSFEAATFDLPPLDADDGAAVLVDPGTVEDNDPRHRFYLRNRHFPVKGKSRFIYNHRSRYNNKRDLELYALMRPGEDSVHVIERHQRSDLMRYRRDVFDDKYARLRPDQPSKTIVSHLAKDGNSYVHPNQTRSITPREGARLQSFPDDFVFCGSQSDQWIQIGNSVPPAFAAALACTFRELLNREPKR
jgi:DNA (cytosine-5)-methyltransferase 1